MTSWCLCTVPTPSILRSACILVCSERLKLQQHRHRVSVIPASGDDCEPSCTIIKKSVSLQAKRAHAAP